MAAAVIKTSGRPPAEEYNSENSLDKSLITLSFGRYLKAIRQQRGIPLNVVADEICVGLWLLTLIETEDHGRLPDEVYVRGILRAYAKAIGVDPNDIVERYRFNRDAFRRNLKAEADILRSGRRSIPRMLLALGVLLVIVCASLYAFYAFQDDSGLAAKTNAAALIKEIQPEIPAVPEISILEAPPVHDPVSDDKLHLKIEVLAETTINVQIDDQPYTKYRLYANDEAQLEASRRFNLLIGNARGVRLTLNGKPVAVEGGSGQSVNLVLSKEDTEQ